MATLENVYCLDIQLKRAIFLLFCLNNIGLTHPIIYQNVLQILSYVYVINLLVFIIAKIVITNETLFYVIGLPINDIIAIFSHNEMPSTDNIEPTDFSQDTTSESENTSEENKEHNETIEQCIEIDETAFDIEEQSKNIDDNQKEEEPVDVQPSEVKSSSWFPF